MIQWAAQTVLGIFLKCTCLHVTSASSALGVLNDYALYKSLHSLTEIYIVGFLIIDSMSVWVSSFLTAHQHIIGYSVL